MQRFNPVPGYETIEQEFEDRTRKAFVEGGADYVIIDSRRQVFQMAMITYCQEQGWVGPAEEVEIDEQYTQWRFRLTQKGKEHFELA